MAHTTTITQKHFTTITELNTWIGSQEPIPLSVRISLGEDRGIHGLNAGGLWKMLLEQRVQELQIDSPGSSPVVTFPCTGMVRLDSGSSSGNPYIREYSLRDLHRSLKKLVLDRVILSDCIEVGRLRMLEHFETNVLDQSQLEAMTLHQLPLQTVRIVDTEITHYQANPMHRTRGVNSILQVLCLARNRLTQVDLQGCPRLREVDLKYNELRFCCTIRDCHDLLVADIAWNPVSFLPPLPARMEQFFCANIIDDGAFFWRRCHGLESLVLYDSVLTNVGGARVPAGLKMFLVTNPDKLPMDYQDYESFATTNADLICRPLYPTGETLAEISIRVLDGLPEEIVEILRPHLRFVEERYGYIFYRV